MRTPETDHEGDYNPWDELKREPYKTEADIVRETGGFIYRDGIMVTRPYHDTGLTLRDCIVLVRGHLPRIGRGVPFD